MHEEHKEFVSATELLDKLFSDILTSDEFDSEIVALSREHLGGDSPLSKAGSNLATALLELAKKRAGGEK